MRECADWETFYKDERTKFQDAYFNNVWYFQWRDDPNPDPLHFWNEKAKKERHYVKISERT